MLFVLSGEIRTYLLSAEGREVTLFRLYPGELCVLSASCVISQITFDTQMTAGMDTEVLVIPANVIAALKEKNLYAVSYTHLDVYKRQIFIRELPNGDNTYTIVAAKSWPMDVVLVNDTVAAIGIEDLFSGRALPTLASAELYVPQLGKSFVMTEETALRSLEKALSKEPDTVRITATGADFGEQETLCPLYLRFADGRRALLFTAGDGADGCADGSLLPCAVFGGESVFERFGVPLEAVGYTRNADGTTTVTNSMGGGTSDGMTSTARYDAQGRLVYWERVWTWANLGTTSFNTETVSYREDGKVASTLGCSDLSGSSEEYTTLTTYIYNERADLTRINVEYDPTDIFGPGYYRELRYDEQNRLVAYVFHLSLIHI